MAGLAGVLALLPAAGQDRRPEARSPARVVRPPGKRPPGAGPRPGRPILERWNRMTPEEKKRLLENLPPERKKQLEERLESYNQLSPEERERLKERYEFFRQLPPEKQERMRRYYRRFSTLSDDRRQLLQQELRELSRLDAADRHARMNSDEFRSLYTLSEQQLLQDISELLARP